jgi:hypothetical protein
MNEYFFVTEIVQVILFGSFYEHSILIMYVLWRPKNFGRHFLDIQVKCK